MDVKFLLLISQANITVVLLDFSFSFMLHFQSVQMLVLSSEYIQNSTYFPHNDYYPDPRHIISPLRYYHSVLTGLSPSAFGSIASLAYFQHSNQDDSHKT